MFLKCTFLWSNSLQKQERLVIPFLILAILCVPFASTVLDKINYRIFLIMSKADS